MMDGPSICMLDGDAILHTSGVEVEAVLEAMYSVCHDAKHVRSTLALVGSPWQPFGWRGWRGWKGLEGRVE